MTESIVVAEPTGRPSRKSSRAHGDVGRTGGDLVDRLATAERPLRDRRYPVGAADLPDRRPVSDPCCGWRSRPSPRPSTRSSSRWRCFPTAPTGTTCYDAWVNVKIGVYFWNTVVLALGSWLAQLLVATTAGFALSVLRPKYANVITGLVLATLFIPPVVLLVPLYIEIVHPPLIHTSLIDSYWAIWLPAGASAFNVVIVKRFFDNLPREIFEAARVDGAGAFRLVLLHRAADVQTHSRRCLRVRGAGLLEGFPLAAAGADQPRRAALVSAAAGDPTADRPGHIPGRPAHRDHRSHRRIHRLPTIASSAAPVWAARSRADRFRCIRATGPCCGQGDRRRTAQGPC